jgi:Fe-S-cluster-containing hydrogenase component 2
MIAQYGFKDGSGDWFVVIDTDKCTGCGDCIEACPAHIFEVGEDEFDPFNEDPVTSVKINERNKIRYSCAPCQPGYGKNPAPCKAACGPGAISHSEGWKLVYGGK